MPQTKLTGVIIGAGHRSLIYASHAERHPEELTIVGVADPDPVRVKSTAERFQIPPEHCFASAEELASRPRFADLAINGTMDALHVPTTLPLLQAGYDVLLEKPITPSAEELAALVAMVNQTGRKVMIGHVLRYAPFYVGIRELVAAGTLGQLISVSTTEHVSYHHMAMGFVRGKWRRVDEQSPILLAKCCHDLDLVCWMKSGVAPTRVASLGNRMYFREEMAPAGSGQRCLVDCTIEAECPYSCRKHYLEQGLWPTYVWHELEHLGSGLTPEVKFQSLRDDNPYGRCVWRCDNDVVDHQVATIEFADQCVASHTLVGGSSRPCRKIHLVGTLGEIEGTLEDGRFCLRHPDPRKGHEYTEDWHDVNVSGQMHGGGDYRLAADFIKLVRGEEPSLSTTSLSDSVNSHLIAFAADAAMNDGRLVSIAPLA